MHKIEDLVRKYNSGECTAEEKELLEQWYQSFDWNNQPGTISEDKIESLRKEVWLAIQNDKIPAKPPLNTGIFSIGHPVTKWWQYAAAAVFLGGIGAAVFYLSRPAKEKFVASITVKKKAVDIDVLPGTSKAALRLADGSIISLDSARTMQLKEEDGTLINKQSGRLVYKDSTTRNEKILFNTLYTPRGGEYQLQLPDGSKVWLNAASSLKFPTRFAGKERTVFLQGEAYFEVAKNRDMPFRVKLDNDLTVQVLGTHFNIMAYDDEGDVRTTLEEGMVKVSSQKEAVFLSPSKQAVMKKKDQSLAVSNADVARALAWKNGMIEFDGDDLPYIMRQLSRWYDVDINFTGSIPKGTYKGAIRRQAPLSKVVEILKLAGVKFKQEDKKLIVTGG